MYIKALLELYAKYCGVSKDPQVPRTRAECAQKYFLSATGQGSINLGEHPGGSSRSKWMRRAKDSVSWPYLEGDGHKGTECP